MITKVIIIIGISLALRFMFKAMFKYNTPDPQDNDDEVIDLEKGKDGKYRQKNK